MLKGVLYIDSAECRSKQTYVGRQDKTVLILVKWTDQSLAY